MDGSQFDRLIKRLGATRLNRLSALRGLTAVSVAALTGVGLPAEEAGAKKKNRDKIRICICSSADPATCRSKKKAKDKAKKTLRRNACAYRGRCQSGVSGCGAAAPITPATQCLASSPNQCGNSAFCCPNTKPQCCVNTEIAGFSCAPSSYTCCGQRGEACAPGSEQCCAGASDVYAREEGNDDNYCTRAGQECCPWDFSGACAADETCCPPDLAVGGEQHPGCIPDDAVCCPYATKFAIGASGAGSNGRGFCFSDQFCCPPIAGTVEGRCCPAFVNGTTEGGCCDPNAADPDAACGDGFVCETDEFNLYPIGCCVPDGQD